MKRLPGAAPAARRARGVVRQAWRGLIQVLVGSDPPAARRWRSGWQRRVVYGSLGVATLVLCAASLSSLTNLYGGLFGLRPPAPKTFVVAGPAVHALEVGPRLVMPDWLMPGGPMVLGVLVALAVVAPMPLAARYPLLGWRIGWVALLLVPLTGIRWWGDWLWSPVQLLVLAAVFCAAGLRHPRPVLWWMWALTLVPWWLWADRVGPGVLASALGTAAFTAAAIAVDAMGSRRRAQVALADQAERTELEQARRAVLEERAKIARELHDVVAHHMSLIAVRAETAPYRLSGLSEPVRAEFGSLSGAAREALADMRRLLGVLRNDEPAGRAPQPRLSDLPILIETARRAGVPVELTAAPALDQVPAGVGVCAYRIVQESLSNAGRHAPGAAITVSVDHGADAVVLRVANGPAAPPGSGHRTRGHAGLSGNGHGPGGPAGLPKNGHGPGGPAALPKNGHGPGGPAGLPKNGHGPGHGLAGMRERVALLGGSLSADPAPDGGFVVSAVLPLGGVA